MFWQIFYKSCACPYFLFRAAFIFLVVSLFIFVISAICKQTHQSQTTQSISYVLCFKLVSAICRQTHQSQTTQSKIHDLSFQWFSAICYNDLTTEFLCSAFLRCRLHHHVDETWWFRCCKGKDTGSICWP